MLIKLFNLFWFFFPYFAIFSYFLLVVTTLQDCHSFYSALGVTGIMPALRHSKKSILPSGLRSAAVHSDPWAELIFFHAFGWAWRPRHCKWMSQPSILQHIPWLILLNHKEEGNVWNFWDRRKFRKYFSLGHKSTCNVEVPFMGCFFSHLAIFDIHSYTYLKWTYFRVEKFSRISRN